MLTIGQLAAYAGVTVRAVRHYHQIGLLPEPNRDASGYRRYSATAAVSLIKIRTLADAGVPLSAIQAMLEADESTFAEAVERIDSHLSGEISRNRISRARQLKGSQPQGMRAHDGGPLLVLLDEVFHVSKPASSTAHGSAPIALRAAGHGVKASWERSQTLPDGFAEHTG